MQSGTSESTAPDQWGRVAEDGTVYVRTADGERAVGSWQAGTPEEGLAHYARRFEQLQTEVVLLEQRLGRGVGDPTQVASSAKRLKETLPTASAVGDLASLETRVDALLARTAEAVEAAKAARAVQREQAVAAKTALAEEAERLAESSEWKAAGDRLRHFGEEWKKITGVDRKTDDALWQRVAAARKRFNERRTAHFAALEEERGEAQQRKERLVKEAESLAASTDWKATADRFKQLMSQWKTAGRASREVDDALWARFKAAQDAFFGARNAAFAEKDEELRGNQAVKEQILAEAEAIDVSKGEVARKQLRALSERWDAAGKVPRDVMRSLEDRMAAVERKVREATDGATPRQVAESPLLVRLREKVADLEKKLAKAQELGQPTADLESQLAVQREWLTAAGGSVQAPAKDQPKPSGKKPTTAWVRADG